jgi:hypothetical protein
MQNITANSATAKWLYNGNGDGRIVVMRHNSDWAATESALALEAGTFTDVNGNRATALEIGSTGSLVVDVHTGTTKQIGLTNLASGTTYYIRIFEWDEDAGTYDYAVESQGFNNPRSFVTLTAVPQPPTNIVVTARNCDFDISWTNGANANGTIMSLFYDGNDTDVCGDPGTGTLGNFSIAVGDTDETTWIEIDLGVLTSIDGFPIENFNRDHLVRLWGYNGTVENVSSTSSEHMFTPVQDCDGPTYTITVYQLNLVEGEWVQGAEVAPGTCATGGRYHVDINWSEPIEDFTASNVILTDATMVGGTWVTSENLEDYSFDMDSDGLADIVGIAINGTFEDCVGNVETEAPSNIAPLDLLSTEGFSVLAGSLISGTTNTVINGGHVGLSPATGAAITGFDSGNLSTGTIYTVDAAGPAGSQQDATLVNTAKNDLTTAYNDAAGRTPVPTGTFLNPSGGTSELNGVTLVPGLYKFDGAALISGNITLDAEGNSNSVWIFQVGTQLTVDNTVQIILANGANAANIFWQVGSLAALGSYVNFNGTILANNAITLGTGATVNGRILARLAEVTMADGVTVTFPGPASSDFVFSIDENAPIFANGPEFTSEAQETCISANNWTFEGFPGTAPINTPANVPVTIGFDVTDLGCCGDATPTVNVQVYNTETSEWDFVAELTTSSDVNYEYVATYTVTTGTPDGDYRFEVELGDCNENLTSWTGSEFSVDNTAPEGYQVECVTEMVGDEEVTTCTEVTEWDAPCLGVGDQLTLCTSVIDDGCGTFNVSTSANPGENGIGLYINPVPANLSWEISGIGTTEDPNIGCVTITITGDDVEGAYNVGIWGTDPAGNFSYQIDENKFFVDNTAPSYSTTDALQTCYGDLDEIDFCFTATDAGCGIESVTAVLTFADETTVNVLDAEPTESLYCISYIASSSSTPAGPATILITITDEAGNETTETLNTTFDFTSPTLVGEPLLPEDDCLSEGQQFCVTFTLEDAGCGLDFNTDYASWNSYAITANESSEEGTWEITVCYDITTEASGSYDFYYAISDVAGNGYTLNIEDAFSVDNTDPVVTDLMIDDDCVTTTDVVTITFNANDAFTCCVDSFFDVFVDLTFSNSSTASATFVSVVSGSSGGWDYTFSYTVLPANPEGTVLVEAYAVDCADNEGWLDATFQIDRTAPVVSGLAVNPNDCVAPDDDIIMTFNAEDIDGCGILDCDAAWAVLTFSNSTTVMVDLFEDEGGNCVASESEVGTDYTAWYTVGANDPQGAVTVTVYVVDGAGNVGSQQLNNAVTIDNTAPVVDNITTDKTCATEADVVTICFDASDLGCGTFDNANLAVFVFEPNEISAVATYLSNDGDNYCYTFTVNSSVHSSGFYDVAVTATDVAGNQTTETLDDAFQVIFAPVMADWSVDYNESCEYTNANPICVDFDFDRDVTGFSADDIWVSWGFEVGSITGEGDLWTVCINALSGSGTGTLYMYVSEVYDCAGNEYTAYDISAGYDYDAPSGYTATFTNSTGGPIDYINAETCDEIYVTITGGVVGEVADWEIVVGEMTYTGSTLITTSPQIVQLGIDQYIDFTGPFAPGNWDVVEEYNSMAEFIGTTILLVTSADSDEEDGSQGENDVDVTITIPANGTISFDWYFETYDVGSSTFDPFGYTINGTFTQLTTDGSYDPQSDSESIPVLAGQVFGFKQRAEDTWLGSGITEIDNFMFEGDSELPVVICDDTEGPVDLAVTLTDCAGNTGIDATDEVTLDVTAPCVTIDAPAHSNVNFEVAFTWTEDVTSFDATDIVVTNGSASAFAGSGADYTVLITPTSEGIVTVGIGGLHGITDLAGNLFNAEAVDCYAPAETIYDITPPLFSTLAWTAGNDNVELEITWNEDVMGSVDDVVLGDLALTFVQNGGTATGASITAINHTEGDDFAYLTIAVVGTPNGCEIIEIRPATGASVFDLASNAQVVTDMISINLVNASSATVQASGGNATNVYAVQAQLNWTRGDGDAVIVILFEDTDCSVDPSNGVNYYANSDFGDGSYLACSDSEHGHVVYYGTGTQVTVDYLTGCTNYRAVVYEVVGGDCQNPNYLTPGHSFEFETAPVATELRITHVNGVEYDYDCELTLPSGEIFSVTVGLFANACSSGTGVVPAYLAYEDYIYLDHYANYYNEGPLADEAWPISQTSKTFTNLQFGIDNDCSNIESPIGEDSYYDWDCSALFAGLDYEYLYDYGPLSFMGGEPGQQAYGITFSGTTNSKFDISWLKSGASTATGEGSLLVIKQGSQVNQFPQDGVVYGAEMGVTSVAFPTDGEDIGSGNRALYYQLDCACDEIYEPRAVTVTGLNANTTYYARVFELRYDRYYTNYGGYLTGLPQEQEFGGCDDLPLRFKEQELVVKYRTTTGTGNPRSKKTSSMEGMFAGLELINFDGRSFERKVELVWATASEGGSLGFEIYRADAETFEFVKIANVAGNVNGGTYKLLDDDSRLEVGKTYVYRLAYIAKDGTIEDLSEIVVPILTMPNSMQSIFVSQVTPNPIVDFGKLTVEMTTEQHLRIEVRNAAGQLVSVLSDQIQSAGVLNFNIDLTNRAQGSYSILVSTDSEAIYVPFMYVK